MKICYCKHCEKEVPMLDEDEWRQIEPLLWNHKKNVRQIHKKQGCDLNVAEQIADQAICDLHFELTGHRVKVGTILHHRSADYGPQCPDCGWLFHTENAATCTNCGGRIQDFSQI